MKLLCIKLLKKKWVGPGDSNSHCEFLLNRKYIEYSGAVSLLLQFILYQPECYIQISLLSCEFLIGRDVCIFRKLLRNSALNTMFCSTLRFPFKYHDVPSFQRGIHGSQKLLKLELQPGFLKFIVNS